MASRTNFFPKDSNGFPFTKKVGIPSNNSSVDKFRILTSINVLDFMMGSNLKALTLACKAKHQNIKWPDVKVVVEGNLKQKCF